MTEVTWPGTHDEYLEWQRIMVILAADCICHDAVLGVMGQITSEIICDAHRDGLTNQRWLDGLVFMRRLTNWRVPGAGKRAA